ncbi:MAG TPA: terminase family protein [Pseudolabrys sp.]|nr:terminase family protein [Pseudolabrys sp.]
MSGVKVKVKLPERLQRDPPRRPHRHLLEQRIKEEAAARAEAQAAADAASGKAPKGGHKIITFATYIPVPKQQEFHEGGTGFNERLFKAGNQLGKTTSGAFEMAAHLTGQYPKWWCGRRFAKPIRAWVGSVSFEAVRDGAQRVLLGEPRDRESWGTRMIMKNDIVKYSMRRGVPDALESLTVRHISGGASTLGFKSYTQGRERWQAETLDIVWFDEEPPLDIYIEGLTRTVATYGCVYLTLTPLKGMSEVMMLFKDCPGF